MVRQSLDFEQNDTAEILGTEYIQYRREDFRQRAQEICIAIPLSLLLNSSSIRPEKEFPRSCELNRSQSLRRTEMVVSRLARVKNLVENLAHGVEISGGS